MKFEPYPYQTHAIGHILDKPHGGLFMEMGLGKTACSLTAVDRLMFDQAEVRKVLVIAPKKVAENVWTDEVEKWDHLRHLKLSLVLGSERQRKQALLAKADIYVINRENVVWLINHYGSGFPFDMVIIDELSSFKSSKSQRFRALRRIRPKISRVLGLTGTPAPNGLMDLWSQVYLLDQGERLGATITGYREKYFIPGDRIGGIICNYEMRDGRHMDEDEKELMGEDYYSKKIYNRISDICISMKAEDYLELPERLERDVLVTLPLDIHQQYLDFERKQILAIQDADITAINAAALTNKLLQFANGAVYDDDKNYYEVHGEKLERLSEILDASCGNPVLVFYNYRHDLERICRHLKSWSPVILKNREHIQSWNLGKIPVLLAHPASAGHGLNMQAGGNIIVWYGLPWSLELYQQAIARLLRIGQMSKTVIIHRLIAKGTMDEEVAKALDNKTGVQEALMQAVKAKVNELKKLIY